MSDRQHIPAHRPPPPDCGWEDLCGEPVAIRIVEPTYPDDEISSDEHDRAVRRDAWVRLLCFVVEAGRGEPSAVGERAILLQSVLLPNGETQSSLAKRLKRSTGYVSQAISVIRAQAEALHRERGDPQEVPCLSAFPCAKGNSA